ncbi:MULTISPECIES: hypothetical protein [unclassified Sphingomonas]|nr:MULTISPECIES: hypothetical protein [unclassified Sphingomonas]AXJ96365.1 hypothetical protein DM480_13585 [Sphingomonas sp. FARSPH]
MSAPGSGERRKTSDALLRQLITDDEYLAVLEYSREEALERDSTVFFLVALLKVFAFAFDRFLRIIEIADAGSAALLAATRQSSTHVDQTLTRNRDLFEKVLTKNVELMGYYVGEMRSAMGEIRVVKEDLEKTASDARATYQLYKRLTGDGAGKALSQQFMRAVSFAHEQAMPDYRQQLSELIGMKLGGFAILAALMTVEIVILGVVILIWK